MTSHPFTLSQPLVSVIMPVWNGEAYVRETVASILDQRYPNIELIVIDDCSTDGTGAILSAQSDRRLRVLTNETNLGVAASLLRGVEAAQGKYVARMDADDICLKSRFVRQVRYLEKNPHVDVLGGSAILFGRPPTRLKLVARRDPHIKAELFFRCSMIHPSVMLRAYSVSEWYDPEVGAAEDYDLWSRLVTDSTVFANLWMPIIRYRLHAQRTSEVRSSQQSTESSAAQLKLVSQLLGDLGDDEERALRVLSEHRKTSSAVLQGAISIGLGMVDANDSRHLVEPKAMRRRAAYEIGSTLVVNVSSMGGLDDEIRFRALRLVAAHPSAPVRAVWNVLTRAIARRLKPRGSDR